jgi:hypothetical protein
MLIHHRATNLVPEHWEDRESKRKYRRIVGGLGWPRGEYPGVGVVLTEDMEKPANYKVVVEVKDFNALALIEKCKALEIEWPVKEWHGNPHDQTMMFLLYDFNRDKKFEDRLKFQGAPLAGEPNNSGYYLPKVIEMFKVGVERLDVAGTETLLRNCQEIKPDTHLNRNIAEFPALAALCYPLSWLVIYGPREVNAHRPLKAVGWML